MSKVDVKEVVKEKYGEAALRVKSGGCRVMLWDEFSNKYGLRLW